MTPTQQFIVLNLNDRSTSETANLIQGDSKCELIFSLRENGKPYKIVPDTNAFFCATKPDAHFIYNDCIIDYESNTVKYIITPQTSAAVGKVQAQLLLFEPGAELAPGYVTLEVSAAVTQSATIGFTVHGTVQSNALVGREIVVKNSATSDLATLTILSNTSNSITVNKAVSVSQGEIIYPVGNVNSSPIFEIIVGERTYNGQEIVESSDEFRALENYIATLKYNYVPITRQIAGIDLSADITAYALRHAIGSKKLDTGMGEPTEAGEHDTGDMYLNEQNANLYFYNDYRETGNKWMLYPDVINLVPITRKIANIPLSSDISASGLRSALGVRPDFDGHGAPTESTNYQTNDTYLNTDTSDLYVYNASFPAGSKWRKITGVPYTAGDGINIANGEISVEDEIIEGAQLGSTSVQLTGEQQIYGRKFFNLTSDGTRKIEFVDNAPTSLRGGIRYTQNGTSYYLTSLGTSVHNIQREIDILFPVFSKPNGTYTVATLDDLPDTDDFVPNTRKVANLPLSSDITVQQLITALGVSTVYRGTATYPSETDHVNGDGYLNVITHDFFVFYSANEAGQKWVKINGGSSINIDTGLNHTDSDEYVLSEKAILANFTRLTFADTNPESGDEGVVGELRWATSTQKLFVCIESSADASLWKELPTNEAITSLLQNYVAKNKIKSSYSTTQGDIYDTPYINNELDKKLNQSNVKVNYYTEPGAVYDVTYMNSALSNYIPKITNPGGSVGNGRLVVTKSDGTLDITGTAASSLARKTDVPTVKSSYSTVAGEVYDVTYINTMIGDIETILADINSGGGVE